MLHCDLRVRWKVASDLRFRAAISEPKTPSFCGISGDFAPSTRKSLAITIVRFWCAKAIFHNGGVPEKQPITLGLMGRFPSLWGNPSLRTSDFMNICASWGFQLKSGSQSFRTLLTKLRLTRRLWDACLWPTSWLGLLGWQLLFL